MKRLFFRLDDFLNRCLKMNICYVGREVVPVWRNLVKLLPMFTSLFLKMLSKMKVFGHTVKNSPRFSSHCCSKSVMTNKNPNIHFPKYIY